jgi:hypothetical protein
VARLSRAPELVSFVSFPKGSTKQKADGDTRSPVRAAGRPSAKKTQSAGKKTEALGASFAATNEDPQRVSPFLLVIVGLLLLASAALGFLLAVQAWRQLRPSRP